MVAVPHADCTSLARLTVVLFETMKDRCEDTPPLLVHGLVSGAQGYALARLFIERQASLWIVTPDEARCDDLYHDLRCFLHKTGSSSQPVLIEQVWRYTQPPDLCSRAPAASDNAVLSPTHILWRLLADTPVVVVTTAASLRYKVLPPQCLQAMVWHIRVGEQAVLHEVVSHLLDHGYRRVTVVEGIGEFALRGGILDLFAPGYTYPLRIEFFGNEVETIRVFAVASQTSRGTLTEATIAPVRGLPALQRHDPQSRQRLQAYLHRQGWTEAAIALHLEHMHHQPVYAWPWGSEAFVYHEQLVSPLAYCPASGLLCCVDAEDIYTTVRNLPLPGTIPFGEGTIAVPEELLVSPAELEQSLQHRSRVVFVQHDAPHNPQPVHALRAAGAPQFFGSVERCIAQLRQWQQEGLCTVVLCRLPLEAQRFQDLLATYDLGSHILAQEATCLAEAPLQPGAIVLAVGQISQGFVWPDCGLVLLREGDIFGDKKPQAAPQRDPHQALFSDLSTLHVGDRVVHVDHGVGLYRRMTFLQPDGESGEFMELEYAEGAKLYVPAYRLNVVQKYSGNESEQGPLDRLGGTTWSRTKERVKTSLLAMAEELVRLHAVRQTQPGHSFSPQTAMHREFENGFEYEETEDQLRAIQEVIADMEQPSPMERLVCGDVGYGKTEVALRAAFKAVYDNKQVAILVPTTVLAQQHYATFQRRFAAYPVSLAVLSRMRTRSEQQRVLDGLRDGTVDIVIGTHRLLQKDMQFKDLGLLVVDEEHRFGVAHKEKMKRFSQHVDVLTLTATPIPRSLQMSLVGLRHFSMIFTPPEGRSATRTMVTPFREDIIQQAIRNELARGGQIFFVHNRIDTLPAIQAMLQRLVPECKICLAHGQMPERRMETLMLQFLERQFDLLLCTTIIESGLDIPSVNTMIINHAETFGLAQLHQLRGRVGRSTQQAYAYLLIPGELILAETARKRIEAIEEFSELGGGFHLASRDLEIRGAGNLLGSQQSGHIASVGFDLYCQLMEETIQTVRGEELPVRVEPELRLPVEGYIPDTYVENAAHRLELYRRLAAVSDMPTVEKLRQEIQDRFGRMPEAVQRLLAVIEIKTVARQLALERLEYHNDSILLTFHPRTPVEPAHLLQWLTATAAGFRFHSQHMVRIPRLSAAPSEELATLKTRLQQLQQSASM